MIAAVRIVAGAAAAIVLAIDVGWTLLSFLYRDSGWTSAEARSLILDNVILLAIAGLLFTSAASLRYDGPGSRRFSLAVFGAGALLLARLGGSPTADGETILLCVIGGVLCLFLCVLLLAASPPSRT